MSRAPRVVLDANVLFPFTLRDVLLRTAEAGFFQPRWSQTILDEVSRNLLLQRRANQEQVARLTETMNAAFPEALVTDYEQHVGAMQNDPKDRHVLAAAVSAKATMVVTQNLKDFRWTPAGVSALSADDFLCSFIEKEAAPFVTILREQSADLKKPRTTIDELLRVLRSDTPRFVQDIQNLMF